jgi:hypothetical protein
VVTAFSILLGPLFELLPDDSLLTPLSPIFHLTLAGVVARSISNHGPWVEDLEILVEMIFTTVWLALIGSALASKGDKGGDDEGGRNPGDW